MKNSKMNTRNTFTTTAGSTLWSIAESALAASWGVQLAQASIATFRGQLAVARLASDEAAAAAPQPSAPKRHIPAPITWRKRYDEYWLAPIVAVAVIAWVRLGMAAMGVAPLV